MWHATQINGVKTSKNKQTNNKTVILHGRHDSMANNCQYLLCQPLWMFAKGLLIR